MKRIIRRALGNSTTCGLTSAIILVSAPLATLANPLGGIVTRGTASFNSSGNVLTINQTSGRSIINWGSFNIAQGETTLFVFSGAAGRNSAVLNRVNIDNPSTIAGMLQSRVGADGPVGGTVLILNPSGILFTPTSQINVGSLIATTLSLSDDNQFLNNSALRLSGPTTAGIRNQGQLNALGDVFLIAHTVQNAGTINAGGVAGLAAGTTVTLAQSGAERLTVEAGTGTGTPIGVQNTVGGQINAVSAELKAAGGNIYALAINNGGAIRANTVAREGGHIYLRSDGGTVLNQGSLEARGTGLGARGGEVQVTGGQVHLAAGSSVDVSGVAGGGTALIGGDYQGRNPGVPNSQQTTVDAGAVIRADATLSGDGGRVVLWSDGITDFSGAISARGGAHGGSGGFVEVSGHQRLAFRGGVDASARGGRLGTLLLDPVGDLFIGTADPGDGSSFIDVTALNAAVADASLQANNNVIFGAAVDMANNGVGLIVRAGNDVLVNNPLTTRGGQIFLSANDNFSGSASGAGSVVVSAGINTAGGGLGNGSIILTANPGTGSVKLGADLATGGGASGFITFNGPVLQVNATHLTASAVNLGPSWNAANNDLQLTIAGPVTVPSVFANVGNFISDGAGGTTVNGAFTTSGSQTYANAVVQTANAHLTATALTLGPSWNAAGNDLQLTINGVVTVPAVFANVRNFTSDGAGGTIVAGDFTTSGTQIYGNAVSQSANAHLTATALTLGPSWNAAGNDLRLTVAAAVAISPALANVRNFTSDGAGGTIIGGNFTTIGSQTYANAVSQSANAHLTGTSLTLGPSWNAAGRDLQLTIAGPVTVPAVFANVANFTSDGAGGTILSGTFTTLGAQTYANAVSQTGNAHLIGTALGLGSTWNAAGNDLQLTIAGPVTVPSTFANVRNFASDGLGGTIIGGDFTTSGSQTYGNPVSQAANAHLTATALTLGPNWNAAGNDLQLTIAAPFTISSALVNVRNFTSDGAGGTVLGGNFTTSGSQTYGNAVSQSANTHLTATALALGPSWNAAGNDLQLTIGGVVTVPSVFANVRNFTSDGVGGTIAGGNFTTSGSQTYGNAVSQSANAHLTATALTLGPSWNAAGNDLQLTIGGAVTVPSVFANVRNFTSDGAGGTTLNGSFTTSGSQTYGNAVAQSANAHLTATALTLGPSWNAAGNDLQLTIGGAVTVPSVFANVRNFTSDGAGGTTLNGSFTTSGSQTYGNAVAQSANAHLTATALTLGPSWNAAGNDLQLTIGGAVTVPSVLANVRNFTSDGAGGTILNGNFTTSGSQTYGNTVAQAGNSHITASALTLGPSWNAAGNDLQLTIASPFAVSAALANVRNFISDGAGGTTIGGNFTTIGSQTYGNTVAQTANTHLTATALTLGPSWNAANNDLQLTIGGAVTVPSVFANVRNFTSDGAGGTTLNGNFTTLGSQTYANAVAQSGNAHLTATALTLGPSWNAAGNDLQLTIASSLAVSSALANVRNFTSDGAGGTTIGGDFTTSGSQTYGNAVAQTANAHLTGSALTLGPSWNAAGNDLQLTIAGAVTVPSVFVNVRNFSSDGAGGTTLNGNFTTLGSQTYGNAVGQTANARVTATALALGSSWNGAGNDLQLTIGGPVTVSSAFANVRNFTSDGAGGTLLNGNFTTSGSQTYGNSVAQSGNSHLTATALTLGPSWNAAGNDLQLTIGGAVTVPSVFANVRNFASDGAGGTLLNGDFATSGSQVYGNAVTLQQTLALAGTSVALNGNILGAGHDLTLNANSTLGGNAGGLGVLTVNGTTALNGNSVATTGNQNYNGTVTLGANNTLSGSSVGFNGDVAGGGRDLTVNGATTIGSSSANTANGLGALTINGATTMNAGSASAGSITVNGAAALNGGSVSTSGAQAYNGAVTLGADHTLSGATIGLNGTLAGGGHNLTANGDTTLGGSAGGLSALAVNGNTTLAGGSVTTSGGQNYNGNTTMSVDNTLSGSTVAFVHGLNGSGKALAVHGDTTVGSAAADTISSLGVLAVSGNATINGTFRDPGQPAGGTTTRFDIAGNLIVKSKVVDFNTASHIANADQNSVNGDWVRGTGIEAFLNDGEAAFFWFAPLGATNPGEDTFRRLLAAVLPRARKADQQETKASEGTRPPIDFAGWNKGSSDVFRAAVATIGN